MFQESKMTEITSDVHAKIVALWLTIAFEPIIHKLSLSKVKYERKRIEEMEIRGIFAFVIVAMILFCCDILDVIVYIYNVRCSEYKYFKFVVVDTNRKHW